MRTLSKYQINTLKLHREGNTLSEICRIAKINIDTDLRLAFTVAVREVLANSPKEFDPRKILGPAKDVMKQVVKGKMRLFGSSGRFSG